MCFWATRDWIAVPSICFSLQKQAQWLAHSKPSISFSRHPNSGEAKHRKPLQILGGNKFTKVKTTEHPASPFQLQRKALGVPWSYLTFKPRCTYLGNAEQLGWPSGFQSALQTRKERERGQEDANLENLAMFASTFNQRTPPVLYIFVLLLKKNLSKDFHGRKASTPLTWLSHNHQR